MCLVCQTAISLAASAMSFVPGIGRIDSGVVPSELATAQVSAILPGTESMTATRGSRCVEQGRVIVSGADIFTCQRTEKGLRWRRS